MSEYLHRGIPNSWNRRYRVVQLTPNTWAACSHVSSALRSSSTCSMFAMSGGLPGLPVHSTCCKGMIADDVTEQVFKQHTMMLFGTYLDLPEELHVLFIWSAVQSTQGFLYCRQNTFQLCTEGILQLEVIWGACGTLLKECADTSHKVHGDLGNIIQVLTHSCLNATYCNYSHHHKGKTLQVWIWKKSYSSAT